MQTCLEQILVLAPWSPRGQKRVAERKKLTKKPDEARVERREEKKEERKKVAGLPSVLP